MEDPTAAKPSPSYSGPAWEAYEAGRAFGREHQDARVPKSVARTSDGTLEDAIDADWDSAEWWCERNLPNELENEHQAEHDALIAGCVGGALPIMDRPEIWAR
jgi:hypothetical protein